MKPIDRVIQQQDEFARSRVAKLQRTAPRLHAYISQVLQAKKRSGLGTFDWGTLTTNVVGTLSDLKVSKELSKIERDKAAQELKLIKEKNASIEKQIAAQTKLQELRIRGDLAIGQQQLSLADKMAMAKQSVGESLLDKPWAIPALLGLGGMLIFSMSRRRSR